MSCCSGGVMLPEFPAAQPAPRPPRPLTGWMVLAMLIGFQAVALLLESNDFLLQIRQRFLKFQIVGHYFSPAWLLATTTLSRLQGREEGA